MDRQDAATLNSLCLTCGGKPESNDVFADQTLMSGGKYEQWCNVNNSRRDVLLLPETSKLSTEREQKLKYTTQKICGRNYSNTQIITDESNASSKVVR